MSPVKTILPLFLLGGIGTINHVALVSSFVVVNNRHPATSSSANRVASSSSLSAATLLSPDVDIKQVVDEIAPEFKLWNQPVPDVQVVDSMPPPLVDDKQQPLKHQYYLLRHGQSTANVDEVISSDRTTLAYTDKHGLTVTGYQQGRDSAAAFVKLLRETAVAGDTVVFVSSPFARARQTAQACLDCLLQDDHCSSALTERSLNVIPDIYYHDLLLERSFGRLDAEAIYTYAYVWPLDKMDVTHTAFDVESVAAVCTRFRQLIHELEQVQFSTQSSTDVDSEDNAATDTTTTHVVCVSHADVLQIAQLYAAGVSNVGEFSSFRFANGEVRRLHVGTGATDTLPDPVPLAAPQRGTGM